MGTPNTEYDAAQALLDLQGTLKPVNPAAYVWRGTDNREDMEKTARLFWNCFLPPDVPVRQLNPTTMAIPNINRLDSVTTSNITTDYAHNTMFENCNKTHMKSQIIYEDNIPKAFKNWDRSGIREHGHPSQTLPRLQTKQSDMYSRNTQRYDIIYESQVRTRDFGTQTEECYFRPNIQMMENTIKNLYERIQSLEAQLKDTSAENSGFVKSEIIDDVSFESPSNDCENMSYQSNVDQYSDYEDTDSHTRAKKETKDHLLEIRVLTNRNVYSHPNDSVPIGDGNASVPARVLKHINWNSYTSATRKLLTAVFSRRILATHSLTGKRSPAFPNKPAKKKLDPTLVNDIVQTVVERCSVPENVVRTSITTKCADESKMFRTRQKNRKIRTGNKNNRENYPSTTSESDD